VVFDRSFLPEAQLEFVVVTDTHYMLDPGGRQVEFESRRQQAARAERALQQIAALEVPFVVHLGDLVQEFPESPGFEQAVAEALAQLHRCGVAPHQVAGNHDVGDKPDPTMPTAWVTPAALATYHARFGCSWYSWDAAGYHFVVLNSQIMNGPLPEAAEQRRWLETDLTTHVGQPVCIFLHLSPFLVDEGEAALGHYDNIGEPARGWLLNLVRRYEVRLLCSAHSHFAFFNRIGAARAFVVPSTAFTRPGFCEVFSSGPPPERGRDDTPKLGFFLVRVQANEPRVHLIRTNGETAPFDTGTAEQRLLTRVPHDLPQSPLGLTLRHPLAPATEVPIAWQSAIRQPVRNDYPLLASIELGVRHLRVPASDLRQPAQRERLAVLRDEGVDLTATWIWSDRLDLLAEVRRYGELLASLELQLPSCLAPEPATLRAIAQCQAEAAVEVTLAPLLPKEPLPGKQHPRTRTGYQLQELPALDQHLAQQGVRVDRVLCRVGPFDSPWTTMTARVAGPPLRQIGVVDWAVELATPDEQDQISRAAEALFAAALYPGARLFLEPLVDLDRTMDAPYGLLDRLCNPRPVFQVVRTLNTILFSQPQSWRPAVVPAIAGARMLSLRSSTTTLVLCLPTNNREATGAAPLVDSALVIPSVARGRGFQLAAGTSRPVVRGDAIPLVGATLLRFVMDAPATL
jgi:hypothetical protein